MHVPPMLQKKLKKINQTHSERLEDINPEVLKMPENMARKKNNGSKAAEKNEKKGCFK